MNDIKKSTKHGTDRRRRPRWAGIISIPVAFEYRRRRAHWSLLPGPHGGTLQPTIESGPLSKPADAWAMRQEFFGLRPDKTDALLEFLNRWGLWGSGNTPKQEWLAEIWQKHDLFRRAVKRPIAEWLQDEFNGVLRYAYPRPQQYPFHFLTVSGCEQAIRVTITLDLLHRVKYSICARPDCRVPFPIESQHERKYCSQYCGHIESVRRKRRTAIRESKQLAKVEFGRKQRS